MTEPRIRAGIYCRLSRAIDGSTEKVEDQERICREMTARLGWDVIEVYSDNSLSAWKKNRRRPRWDAMLSAVDEGLLDALAVYHGDRLIRHPGDLEKLIDLADSRGIKLAAPTGTRNIDNDDDRTMMRVEAAFAWRESANTSRRKKAGYDRLRRKGLVRPGGPRAFGFERDGVTHSPAEAAVIREAAAAIMAGHSVGSVIRQLRERGVTASTGNPMTHNTLRRLLISPRVAGLMPDGISRAAWEPVLGRPEWEMLRAVLLANKPLQGAGYGARHLLSGIAACGACGGRIYTGSNANGPCYMCKKPGCGKVARSMPLLDAYVTGRVAARLNREDNPVPEIDVTSAAGRELAALTARREETVRVIEQLASNPGQRIDVLARALASFDEKIAAVRGQLAGQSGRKLLGQHAGITRQELAALPLDVRRSLVRAAYAITVLPASRRGPGFDPRDVVMSPIG